MIRQRDSPPVRHRMRLRAGNRVRAIGPEVSKQRLAQFDMRLVAKLGEKGRARWMAGGVKLIREVTMSGKTVGNLILMTLICAVIFWVFMALRPARADGAMPDAMVG